MSLLCLNAGSSTIKMSLFDDTAERETASLVLPWAGGENGMREAFERGFALLTAKAPEAVAAIHAVGHRVVHCGDHWCKPTRIDAHVRATIACFEEFAPLHNISELQAIAAVRASICDGLECLGLRLDAARNAGAEPDADVSADDSAGRVLVIRVREALMIARATRQVALAEPARV